MFGRIGADLFVVSGILSLLILYFLIYLLKKFSREKFKNDHNILAASVLTIFILMNFLYFKDIIPPIPLSIKQSGILHGISRTVDGNYEVKVEPRKWTDLFDRYPDFNRRPGETVYAFSAVFSPVKFATEVIHEWQVFNEDTKEWQTTDKISLPILGGRDGGFRTYSAQNLLSSGKWRVRVLTKTDQVIGQIRFEIKNIDSINDINLETRIW